MKFFHKMEYKYGKYAIHNLMYYIVILYAVGLVINLINPAVYWVFFSLDIEKILHGQIWRLVTFLVYPPTLATWAFMDIFFGILALFMYHSLGLTLERVWGAFRFNAFFFMGVIGQILAAFVGYLVFHQSYFITTGFLNFSIFLAFAICFPDVQFLLFMVIPVKAKWLAIAESAVYAYSFFRGSASTRCEIVLSLLNVLVFVAMTRNYQKYSPREIKRKRDFKAKENVLPTGKSLHKCAVCGRTEADGVDLEFRYCSKCAGGLEYCMDHLYTHQHVTEDVSRIDDRQ